MSWAQGRNPIKNLVRYPDDDQTKPMPTLCDFRSLVSGNREGALSRSHTVCGKVNRLYILDFLFLNCRHCFLWKLKIELEEDDQNCSRRSSVG